MNKKLKFKGSMKRFMRWPLYLTILLVLLNVLIFTVNVKAGLLSLARTGDLRGSCAFADPLSSPDDSQ